jgi:4-hydroxy-3-methylbut-2-enyl diphosphate reductase
MDVERVVLARPRGFCAGVEMAIKALVWMCRVFEPPIYCYHEIVHNQVVVDRFVDMGVVFVDDVAEVPPGAPLMLSAHGTAPEVEAAARTSGRVLVNAVCPLVTKVHHEMKVRAAKGYTVIYVGHAGHEEAIGTMAVAPGAVRLVESVADVDALDALDGHGEPGGEAALVALLTQTTLSQAEAAEIKERAAQRFPTLWMPGRSDLCFATTNRQAALSAIADQVDAMIVVGSANSSNTLALEKVALAAGCARVLRVNTADELPEDLSGTVGVTAGASAPEELVSRVVARLAPRAGVTEASITDEDEYFPPPRELRDLARVVALAVGAALGGPADTDSPPGEDRQTSASTALDQLSLLGR